MNYSSSSNQITLSNIAIFNKADLAILTAIRCPQSGQGVIRALETACEALDAYSMVAGLPRVSEWSDACSTLLDKVEALQSQYPQLGQYQSSLKLPVFSLLASPPSSLQGSTGEQLGLEILGRILIGAISSNDGLSVTSVEAWATLRRARKSGANTDSDWAKFCISYPRTEKDIRDAYEWIKSKNLRDLLDDLMVSLVTSVSEVNQQVPDTTARNGSDASSPLSASSESASPEKSEPVDPDSNEDPNNSSGDQETSSETDETFKNSITGLKIKNAMYAKYTQKFGLRGDKDRLDPGTVRLICEGLQEDFRQGDKQVRDQVLVAYLSLKASLPAGKVIQLPLGSSSYPYIDVQNKDLVWNYRYCTESAKSADPLHPRNDIELIRIALDEAIGSHLIWLQSATKDARNIAELIGIDSTKANQDAWLTAYRKYLRLQGNSVHPAYDARFAYSGAEIYRHVCGGEVDAIFLAQDFNSCAMGLLHYITLPTSHIIEVAKKWDEYLKFEPRTAIADTEVKGAIIYLSRADAIKHRNTAQNDLEAHLTVVKTSTDVNEVINTFNHIATARLFDFIFLTGHRGTKITRLTQRALYTHGNLIHIYDKDVGSYQSDRLIPCHALVEAVLSAWQADIKLLEQRVSRLGLSLQDAGRRAVLNSHPDRTAFFHIRTCNSNGVQKLERKTLGSGKAALYAKEYYQSPVNIGRHFLVSELLANGTDMWLVRALTGHARNFMEVFSDAMAISPKYFLASLGTAIDELFVALSLQPTAGSAGAHRSLLELNGTFPKHPRDPYLHTAMDKSWRVLPPPFDKFSLTAIQLVEKVRQRLMKTTIGDHYDMDLVGCMAVFDGLSMTDQQCIFKAHSQSVQIVSETACWAWYRERCSNEIVLPINPRTLLALRNIDLTQAADWNHAVRGISNWLRCEFPSVIWVGSELDIYSTFMAMVARWRRYQVSPQALTAYSEIVPTTTPSRRSILRLSQPADKQLPIVPLERAVRIGKSKSRLPISDAFVKMRGILHEAGNTKCRTGEERQRAVDLRADLDLINANHDARIACAIKVLEEEIRLWGEQVTAADQFSSLYGYFGEVAHAMGLLGTNDDLSKMNGEEIEEWVYEAKRHIDSLNPSKASVKEDANRFHGLKRFLVICRKLGWDIPGGMFADEEKLNVFSGMRKSAASTLFLKRDNEEIVNQLKSHFHDWEDLGDLALLCNAFDEHAPLRNMERNVLRKNCIVRAVNQLSIQTDGFSHLKSRHGVRLIKVPQELSDQLLNVTSKATDHPSRFAFLPDDAKDWTELEFIDESIISAMVTVTGEASVRQHSRRGAAICNRINPDWELTARAALRNEHTVAQYAAALKKMHALGIANFILATREAGHGHSLTTSVYYFSTWPFHFASEMLASMDALSPQTSLLLHTLDRTDNLRTIRHRNKLAGLSPCIWKEIATLCSRQSRYPQLAASDTKAVLVPRSEIDDTNDLTQRGVLLMGLLLLGARVGDYSTELRFPDSAAKAMDEFLPAQEERDKLVRRRRGKPTTRALLADRVVDDNYLGRLTTTMLAG